VSLAALGAYAVTLRVAFPATFATLVALLKRVVPSVPRLPRPRRAVEVSS
jgi:hypothetical protein